VSPEGTPGRASPAVRATASAAVPAIERAVDLAAAPDRVWRAITEAPELTAWLGSGASFRAEAGADGWVEWQSHGRFALRVETVEPGVTIAWRWSRDPGTALDDGPSTLVTFRLEPRPGGGTRFHLRETGFVDPEDRAGNSAGWTQESGDLLAHLATQPFEGGIRRRYHLRSSPQRVWSAFTDPDQLRAWWGGVGQLEVRAGFTGWWDWPGLGRYAMVVDVVEPMTYLAWRWATVPDRLIEDADQVLRTEWSLVPRADGGTDLHLLESGFSGPEDHRMNDTGWDGDVLPGLRRVLGEAAG